MRASRTGISRSPQGGLSETDVLPRSRMQRLESRSGGRCPCGVPFCALVGRRRLMFGNGYIACGLFRIEAGPGRHRCDSLSMLSCSLQELHGVVRGASQWLLFPE